MGLDGVLRRHAGKLRGILNGLDTEVFDPGKDPYLPAPYTREDPSGKARAKEAFRERTGLRPPSSPTWAAWITKRVWTLS